MMSERALSSTSWAVASLSVWGGWGRELVWMAGTVSTLKRGCQRVSLSSGTDTGGTIEDRNSCTHHNIFPCVSEDSHLSSYNTIFTTRLWGARMKAVLEELLTLWCCLTMSTRFQWKMCLLSRRREADRTGRALFWSEKDTRTYIYEN